MMIGLLIASLIAAIGYVLYRAHAQTAATSIAGGAPPTDAVKTPDQTVSYGGIKFVTVPGQDAQMAAAGGATAYNPNDPDVIARRNDAIARADKLEAAAAAQGKTVNGVWQQPTVDDLYQAHTAQQVIAGKAQTAAIFSYAKTASGFTPTGSGDDLYKALSVQTPLMGSTPPPGQYWNYATQKWEPLIF